MKSSMQQEDIVDAARQTLDDSVDTLNVDVARRLQQARIDALSTVSAKPTWWKTPSVFASVLAAVFAVGMVTTITLNDFSNESISVTEIEETEELYQDLDFYVWLAKEESAS